MDKLKIFVGWDSREDIAYQVCKFSIESRSSIDVEIIPLRLEELRRSGIYTRENDPLASTEFTFSRFFTPYLSNFSGPAVFCDCDFLWNCDAKDVLNLFDDKYAVQVVKHDYTPKELFKMDGQVQHIYPKKNWSSMIIFNTENPSNMVLTPQFLNQAAGSTLHQFKWLEDKEIGGINHSYNWLEGWYKEPVDGIPKIIHYTRGNVYFENFQNVDYADLWKEEYKKMAGKVWETKLINCNE